MASRLSISRIKGVVLSLIPVTMLLLLSEILLRLAPFQLEVGALQIKRSDSFEVQMFQSHLESRQFIRDPATFWAPKASMAPFNSLGYRGKELPEGKEPGEFRILAVGDSNTLGNKRISWANEISGSLAAQRLGVGEVAVINASAYGNTSFPGSTT